MRKTPEKIVIRNCRFEQTRETIRLEFTGLNRWCRQKALKEITFENLIYGLLLCSANDSAVAIAIAVSGSVEGFVALMNQKAQKLGLTNTHFTNPHGLYDEEHYTTARELALIAATAMENEVFLRIISSKKHTMVPVEGNTRVLYNHNKMLSLYKDAIGVKTGYTKKSGRTLVSAAKRDGLTLIAVTLNAPDDWNDHAQMLDAGFVSYERLVIDAHGYSLPHTIVGGRDSYAILTNSKKIELTIPRGMRDKVTLIAEPYSRFAFAPAKKGDVAGELALYLDGKRLAEAELIYATDIPWQRGSFDIIEWIKKLFGIG